MIRDIIRKFKESSIQQKLGILLIVALVLLILIIFAIYSVGLVVRAIAWDLEGNPWFYALSHPLGKIISSCVAGGILVLFIILILNTDKKNTSGEADEHGVHIMDKGTFGSAKWMKEQEARKVFEIANIKDTSETIYGQFTDKGERVVAYKSESSGATGNRNVYMLAAPGSGKSFTFVRTEILQAIKRGESVIVTDPSGELYTDLSQYCRDKEIDVKVLNVSDPDYSDFWDCLEETIDPETERLDDIRLSNFVSIYMKNAKDDTRDEIEDFWYISANNILQAVIAFTSFEHEQEIINGYVQLYNKIMHNDKGFVNGVDDFVREMNITNISFKECRKRILAAALERNYVKEEIEECFNTIHSLAEVNKPYTIEQCIYNLNFFNKTEAALEKLVTSDSFMWHPAADAYIRFRTNDNDNVRKSAIQGAQMRFKPLSTGKIKNMLSHKGIHISDFNLKQSVYFVVTSDKPTTTKPIISLFFSFVFTDAQEQYDKFQMLAKEQKIENPCLPVSALLDEFFSLGVLCGSAEAFGTVCSTCRKRKIYLTIVTQTYSQLEALYGKHIKDVIQGCCSTFLFLGGNDLTSLEFVSDTSGETTALSETHEELTNLLSTQTVRPGYRAQGASRNLLTKQESRRFKKRVLIVRQGEQPLEVNPFPWTQHPAYINGECNEKSIYSTIVPISIKLKSIYARYKQIESISLRKTLNSLHICNPLTGKIIESDKYEETSNINENTSKYENITVQNQDQPKENVENQQENNNIHGDFIEFDDFENNDEVLEKAEEADKEKAEDIYPNKNEAVLDEQQQKLKNEGEKLKNEGDQIMKERFENKKSRYNYKLGKRDIAKNNDVSIEDVQTQSTVMSD